MTWRSSSVIWYGLLPPEFYNVSFYWQWSCGHGLDGGKTLRAHLWFWCREKHTDREYEELGEVDQRRGRVEDTRPRRVQDGAAQLHRRTDP